MVEQVQARDFGVELALAYQALVDELHADLGRHGFTRLGASYGYILRTVAEGPLNQRELAARLGVTDQAIGKVVAELVRRKLLVRRRDPQDGRAHHLALAPRGEALLAHARRFHARFERALAAELGADVGATRRVLARIIARRGPEGTRLRIV